MFRQTVFDKILTLPTTSLNIIDFGLISSLISADMQVVDIYSYFQIVGYSSMIVLVAALSILLYYYGVYILFAPFWIAVLVLLNSILSNMTKPYLMKKSKLTDSIGVAASEMVKGMKNIKFNTLEQVSFERVMDLRKKEAYLTSIYYILTYVSINIGTIIPSFIVGSIYIARTRNGYTFDTAEVFFLISLSSMLLWPSVQLVKMFNFYIRQRVSIQRVSNFMAVDAVKKSNRTEAVQVGEMVLQDYTATWIDEN